MPEAEWMARSSPAFRLMIATSWLAPEVSRASQEEAIRNACSDNPDWTEYLLLVERHRIPAVSWAALKSVSGIDIPDGVQKELHERSDACRMQSMIHLGLLAGVLRAFNRAGIPVMPLKGPLLSQELYGDAGIRQSVDLDVLVAPEQIGAARECLRGLRWVDEFGNAGLTERQWEFKLRHDQHLAFTHAKTNCVLELHWRAEWKPAESTADRIAGSALSHWQGCSYRTMNPVDLTLHLCHHGSKHAWFRSKWLGDLARIFALGSVDWQAALEKAHRAGRERSVLVCLRLLKEAYGLDATRLTDGQADSIPPWAMRTVVRNLTTPSEPRTRGTAAKILELFRSAPYKFWLWPSKSAWECFALVAIPGVDFKLVRLPNRLFWLYLPLRPFLFAWRHRRDFSRGRSSVNTRIQVEPGPRSNAAGAPAAQGAHDTE